MGNLHLVTGYAGQAHITADDHASLNAAIVGSGQYVMNRGNNLSASVISNNQIRIYDGDIVMQGRHIRLADNTYVDLTIENGSQGLLRNDLIVARYTKNSATGVEDCDLVVIKGTSAASNPVDPEYTIGDIFVDQAIQNDMPLYRVPLDGLTVGELVPLFTMFKGNEIDSDAVNALIKAYYNNNAVKIATGTYKGTGTYGSENKCSLTFDFVPKFFVLCYKNGTYGDAEYGLAGQLAFWIGQPGYEGNTITYKSPLAFSLSEKTLSWYNSNNETFQFNYSGYTYYWFAIG